MHVLVVEDDRALADLLRRGLSQERHVVDLAHDGVEGLEQAASGAYDAVILDLSLPRLDGLDLARRLRAGGATMPVLMLTARDGCPTGCAASPLARTTTWPSPSPSRNCWPDCAR